MNILIGADLVPTESNKQLFINGDADTLLGNVLSRKIREADFRIFNLEVPLVDEKKPIAKGGPNLIAPTKCVEGYKAMHVDLLTLANNHILDQDQQGLKSTCTVLDEAGIAYTGVGKTPEEAAKPYIFECDGKRIGIYACAEHEFSIVTEYSAGANPIDLLETPDHIASLKAECDFVIVLYHGGKEYYRYPSPNLQKICRKLVEKGADLVVCQHSHCIGCEEKYLNGRIVYGQGNFLFDGSESEYWQTSLLVQISDNFEINYIPLKKNGNGVRCADKSEAEMILEEFRQRSAEIEDDQVLREKYAQFAASYLEYYMLGFSGIGRKLPFRLLEKLFGQRFVNWFVRQWYQKETLLAIQNYVDCEAHKELLIKGLEKRIFEQKNK